jgi:hypothetical protein
MMAVLCRGTATAQQVHKGMLFRAHFWTAVAKRSGDTAFSCGCVRGISPSLLVPKAPSPLRSAGAVQRKGGRFSCKPNNFPLFLFFAGKRFRPLIPSLR